VEPEAAAWVLLETKVPPVNPAGADAVKVLPTSTEEALKLTFPAGQEPGLTL